MKKIALFLSLLAFTMLGYTKHGAQTVYAKNVQPGVTGVSPTTVKPGDIITFSGAALTTNGIYDGCEHKVDGKTQDYPCPYTTVVGAYKAPRTHSDYSGSQPDFQLPILSTNGTTAQAQVPTSIPSGDGTYNLGWFWKFNPSDWPVQGNQLIGFAHYDIITVTGAGVGAAAKQVTPKSATPTPLSPKSTTPTPLSPSATDTSPTPVTPNTADTSPAPVSPQEPNKQGIPEKVKIPIPQFVRSILGWIQGFFKKS